MTEEEIRIIRDTIYNDEGQLMSYVDIYNLEGEKFVNAIVNLLTEYIQQQKEIKELKDYIRKYRISIPMPEEYQNCESWGTEVTIAQKEYIAKDLIKEKIEDYTEKAKHPLVNPQSREEYTFGIRTLQSLLEEK